MDRRTTTALLLACGALGPPLFVVIFLVEGATRPGYSAWHNTVSQLALGEAGWLQAANFYVCGLLSLCFAAGLRRALPAGARATWAAVLIGLFGLGLIAAGLFVTDPGLGYPPGTQAKGLQSLAGWVHWLASLVACGAASAAAFVLAQRFGSEPGWRGWPAYSRLTGFLIVLFFLASSAASMLDDAGALPNAPVGALQRLSIVVGCAWIGLLAVRLLNPNSPAR